MSAVTSRYTGSYESTIESDLSRLAGLSGADEFNDALERMIAETLTDDYWNINLPSDLQSTAARSPALYAYYAALNLLNARVLFSSLTVRELFDPAIRGDRVAIERHHLFPRAFLKRQGISASRDTDQTANYALLEWPDNAAIGDAGPSDYAPAFFARLAAEERERMMRWHALPDGWDRLAYADFLPARRLLMARVVRDGFMSIGRTDTSTGLHPPTSKASTTDLIAGGENGRVEFKSTARWSLNDGRVHDGVEQAVVKTIAGFANSAGGTLLIGVKDDGEVIGLEHDYATLKRKDRDGFESWLSDLVERRMGRLALGLLETAFEAVDGCDVARVHVTRESQIVFLNPSSGQPVDDVFVRFGNSTRKLTSAEVLRYSAEWNNKPLSAEAFQSNSPEGL